MKRATTQRAPAQWRQARSRAGKTFVLKALEPVLGIKGTDAAGLIHRAPRPLCEDRLRELRIACQTERTPRLESVDDGLACTTLGAKLSPLARRQRVAQDEHGILLKDRSGSVSAAESRTKQPVGRMDGTDRKNGGEPAAQSLPGASELIVPVSRLGSALSWLRAHGVSVRALAEVFGTTEANVRVLTHRASRGGPVSAGSAMPRSSQRVRRQDDGTAPSAQRDLRIEQLTTQVDAIRQRFVGSLDFGRAAAELKRMLQYPGFPAHLQWLRFIASVHRERAWFLVHSGYARSAVYEARCAIEARRLAYRQSDSRDDLRQIAAAALIESQANLLQQTPEGALKPLELVEEACETAGMTLGSDYWRQRGVLLLQLGRHDDAAHRYFDKSTRVMEELGELSRIEELNYTGPRHTNFLTSKWDAAEELASGIVRAFGSESLHASVSIHWAVATGLRVDSPSVLEHALGWLERNTRTAAAFGHQRTINYLLSITPALQLPAPIRAEWLRFLLYVNAFRHR